MSASQVAIEKLNSLGHLSEWLLHDVRWCRFGSEIEIHFNNVFNGSGRVRNDALENPHVLVIRLIGVQSFVLSNHLSAPMLDEPERLDWGLSEIAGVRLNDSDLADRGGVKFGVLWDGPRNIEVLAVSVEIVDIPS